MDSMDIRTQHNRIVFSPRSCNKLGNVLDVGARVTSDILQYVRNLGSIPSASCNRIRTSLKICDCQLNNEVPNKYKLTPASSIYRLLYKNYFLYRKIGT